MTMKKNPEKVKRVKTSIERRRKVLHFHNKLCFCHKSIIVQLTSNSINIITHFLWRNFNEETKKSKITMRQNKLFEPSHMAKSIIMFIVKWQMILKTLHKKNAKKRREAKKAKKATGKKKSKKTSESDQGIKLTAAWL